MPFYLYCCPVCNTEKTVLKKISEMDDEEYCDHCEDVQLNRAIPTRASFQLKGNGWYNDGYTGSKNSNN